MADASPASQALNVTVNNNSAVSQVLSSLALTWPQATNGNLVSVAMGGTSIYTTSTGGGSLSTSSFAGAASVRTISAGASKTLTLTFANNASSSLANYTGTGTFNPFGPLTLLP